jgi:hypothetical protein
MGAARRGQRLSDSVIVSLTAPVTCGNVHCLRPHAPARSVVVLDVVGPNSVALPRAGSQVTRLVEPLTGRPMQAMWAPILTESASTVASDTPGTGNRRTLSQPRPVLGTGPLMPNCAMYEGSAYGAADPASEPCPALEACPSHAGHCCPRCPETSQQWSYGWSYGSKWRCRNGEMAGFEPTTSCSQGTEDVVAVKIRLFSASAYCCGCGS